jgi:DnaK suppressor protein
MDQGILDELRAQLEEDRAQQLEVLEEHGADAYDEAVTDLQNANDGFADSAQATEARAELLAHIEVARQRVQAIDEALARMDEGTYGICVSCGREIPAARLEVRPLSVTCVECAARAG